MKDLKSFYKEESSKSKPLRDGEGADDKQYFALMSEYKIARRVDRELANEILDKAMKLGREGDVSKDAKLGAAYL